MVGIATLTMKASTPNMNCAATTVASTHHRRATSASGLTIWCMCGRLVGNLLHPTFKDFGHPRDYLRGNQSRDLWPDCCMARRAGLQPDFQNLRAFGTIHVRLRHAG